MGDEPRTLVKPRSITRARVVEQYVDQHGLLITKCPTAYAEGADSRNTVRPKNHIDMEDL